MSIESEVKKLMNIDEKIKENLEDENKAMQELSLELAEGLKKIKFENRNIEFP